MDGTKVRRSNRSETGTEVGKTGAISAG